MYVNNFIRERYFVGHMMHMSVYIREQFRSIKQGGDFIFNWKIINLYHVILRDLDVIKYNVPLYLWWQKCDVHSSKQITILVFDDTYKDQNITWLYWL